MDESEADSSQNVSWQVVQTQEMNGEQMDGPLLVAMQPGSDVPDVEAVEVVVMTENGQEVTENEIQTVVDANTGEIVAIGAIEEVHEERFLEDAEYLAPSDNKGELGERNVASSSDSSDDDSSDSEDEDEPIRKRPKQREFAYRLQWKSKDMQDAMKAVNEKKMTIRGAAKKFKVPYSTLKDRVHGRVKHGTKPGVKTALSPEEEEDLVKYIKDMESAGFQLRCIDVRDRAGEILQLNHGHNSPYKDGSPGHNWLAGFLKRHPGLEFKKAMNRSVIPSLQKQKAMCRRFFDVTNQIYKKNRMTHKPERVYTLSEMKFSVYLDATVLMCSSAEGTQIPPFVIFRGQRMKLTSARDAYPEAFFTCSYDGHVNDVVLLWWFRDHFLKKIPSSNHRPCVLFVSRSVGDVTFQLAQLAREERIHIVSIPPGISHLLEPLDDSIADSIRSVIIKKAKKWEEENPSTPFTQKVLAQILQKVWKKGIGESDIVAKFAANGVFPCNSLAITPDRIAAEAQVLKDQQKSPSPSAIVDNAQFSGLSLLSALSSHEYASLEHIYGPGDTPTKATHVLEAEEVYDPEAHTEKARFAKRKRSDRHAEKERQNRMSQEIEKIIEEAKERSSDRIEKSVLASLMEVEHPKDSDEKHLQQEEEQPSLTQELLSAKENFEQINRAIESIGGSIDSTGAPTTSGHEQQIESQTQLLKAESVAEEVVVADSSELNGTMIRVYDQDGNEVVVEEVHEVLSEEIITDHNMEGVIEEEVIHDDGITLQGQEQPILMEQVITTEEDGQEVILHNLDHQVALEHDQTNFVTIGDSSVTDSQTYTEEITSDQIQFLEPDAQQGQQYQLFSEEEAQNLILQQQQHQQQQQQQELPTVIQTTTKSRGKGAPRVRILKPQVQYVQQPVRKPKPKPPKSVPRIIKLVQSPGSNSMQLDIAQIQQILQLSGNSQVISTAPSTFENNIVMLPDDCVQEVVLE